MRRTPASSSTISTREVGLTSWSLPETRALDAPSPGGAWPAGARGAGPFWGREPAGSGSGGRRAGVGGRRAARAAVAGAAGVDLVDLVVEARGQVGEDLVLLGLRELARRDGGVEIRLGRRRERGLEAVGRLAVGRRDGRERLAGVELRAQVGGRDADVASRRRRGDTGPPPGRRGRGRGRRRPPGPPPSAKSGASALARRASIAVAWAFVSVPAVTCASIWSTIAFLIAAVRAVVLTPSWPAASAAIAWVCACGSAAGARWMPRPQHRRRRAPRARRRRLQRAGAACLRGS